MATKGHVMIGDGSGVPTMLAVGTNCHVLTACCGEATGVKWAAASSVSAANQTEQEAACITTKFTSPGTQQFHPSAVKGWVQDPTSSCSPCASYNVSGVASGATGIQTVSWDVDFSSGNYSITTTSLDSSNPHVSACSVAAGSWVVKAMDDCHNLSDVNYAAAAYGDQVAV
jgi:hypothetical protein